MRPCSNGSAHRVGDPRTCGGASAGAHHDVVVLGPLDVVGDDEEVAAELHLADDAALVVRLLRHVFGHVAVVAALQTLLDLLQEQRRLVPAFRAGELGHERAVLVVVEDHVAAFRDLQRVVARLGELAEQLAHLLGRLDVVAGAVELETVRVIEVGAGVDAQHRVLRLRVLGVHVVGVVRGEQRRVELLRDGEQARGDLLLDLQAVVHELDEEVVAAEDVLEFAGRTQRLVELAESEPGLDDARRAPGRGDHAFGIGGEHLLIHTRVTLDAAFEVRHGGGLDEVDEALVVLRPHRHVGDETAAGDVVASLVLGAPMHARLVLTRGLRRHIRLDADDRLDAVGHAVRVHLVCAVHVAVVGDRHGRHAELGRVLGEIRDLGRPVEQRIVRVVMQMHEVTRICHAFHPTARPAQSRHVRFRPSTRTTRTTRTTFTVFPASPATTADSERA